MDRISELSAVFRRARKFMHAGIEVKFSRPVDGFAEFAAEAVEVIHRHSARPDDFFASVAGEVIPRLFAVDVTTGYSFFHDREVLRRVWDIYNAAAGVLAGRVNKNSRVFRRKPPYRTAVIASMFSDALAPAKTIANFAMSLDRTRFEPVMVVTNQVDTMERRSGYCVVPFSQMKLGKQLLGSGIDIVGMPPQDNILTLSQQLMEFCCQMETDIAITSASMFSFPEACVACSGVSGSFFDMHQGFPLYVNGIDAILHWVKATRQKQLGLWIENGGRVIDFHEGIEIPELPETMPEKTPGLVRFITVSNYIEQRFSPEFCAMATRLLRDFPQTVYRIIGNCDIGTISGRFAPEVRDRLEFIGTVHGAEMIREHFLEADIYLNEFPVSGVRVCLEAMCACLPVITMRCGELHVNVTAAEHVGDFAIDSYDPERYYALAASLIRSPEERRRIGTILRRRMEQDYDYRKTFSDLADSIQSAHEEKFGISRGN